jgi:RNA polymerase sigma-70 factor (ECF subfamily)
VWLCEIAKRLWYKELGKDKLISLDEMEEIQADVNLEKQHILNMDKMELFKLLHSLDAASREVVYLRLTGELSFSEIGNIMGKTENWARVTFYRGKQKIVKGRKIDE